MAGLRREEGAISLTHGQVSRIPSAKIIGGKARGLAILGRQGVQIPEGFVLGTKYFHQWLEKSGDLQAVEAILRDTTVSAQEAATSIRERLGAAPVPGDTYRAIHGIISAMSGEKALSLAVRSSAAEEDGEWYSYAGIFRSCLDVTGEKAVIEAVLAVWMSALEAPAIAYRRRFELPDSGSMAIVIQRMLRTEWAGTLFCRDPVTGNSGYVIECHQGSGESIVGGRLAVAQIRVYPDGSPAAVHASSGVGWRAAEAVWFKALLDTTKSVRNLLKSDNFEMEWGIEDGKIHILQVRPITTILQKGMGQ